MCSFLLEVASVGYVDSLTEQLFPVYVHLRTYARMVVSIERWWSLYRGGSQYREVVVIVERLWSLYRGCGRCREMVVVALGCDLVRCSKF